MLIRVDSASERPIYVQIADAVRGALARGELVAGEKLPPASEIARGLDVNKHTVLHAYKDLRDEGLIDLRRGRGAVVTPVATEIVDLHREIEQLVDRAAGLGVSAQTLAALVAGAGAGTGARADATGADTDIVANVPTDEVADDFGGLGASGRRAAAPHEHNARNPHHPIDPDRGQY